MLLCIGAAPDGDVLVPGTGVYVWVPRLPAEKVGRAQDRAGANASVAARIRGRRRIGPAFLFMTASI
jgi:hypothetical protein